MISPTFRFGAQAAAPKEPPPVVEKPAEVVADKPNTMAADLNQRDVSFFDRKFSALTDLVSYDPAWSHENELFTELVANKKYHRHFGEGKCYGSVDEQGRKSIIIGTLLGPVVVYQRFPEGTNTLMYKAHELFHRTGLIRSKDRLTRDDLEAILGQDNDTPFSDYNIGKALNELLEAVAHS